MAATEEDGDEREHESGADEEDEETQAPALPEPTPASLSAKAEKRPKKRRKVDPEEVDEPPEEVVQVVSPPSAPPPDAKPKGRRLPTPTIADALPSFPAPRRPDAPSKATLALQGLDKALIEADLVEPSKVLPIAETDEEDTTGMSSRVRKRLRELGITELFAGTSAQDALITILIFLYTVQTAVVPLLLSDPKLRQLYLPYNPPQDLCVSAPTGSGKTLAYVVPIVEVRLSLESVK